MDRYEREQIADALKRQEFAEGQYIFAEGDNSDQFYLLIEGEAEAHKLINGGTLFETEQKCVLHYKSGDYFGELALLKNQPRAASIFCKVAI